MEINWGFVVPILIAIVGAAPGLVLLGIEFRKRQTDIKSKKVEIKSREAEVAERFVSAAVQLVEGATSNTATLDKRISKLEVQVSSLSLALQEAHANLRILLSVIDWLLSGIKMLSYQIRADGNDPIFELDEERLKLVGTIKDMVGDELAS